MAEEASSAPAAAGKMTMVAGVDESDHSFYALQWALQHFFPPGQTQQYRLVVVTAKPSAASAVGLAGPGAADVLPFVEADLKRTALRVIDKAKELCTPQVTDAEFEAMEGDARSVLCDAVERHNAEMLVVGSHGYGAIKRSFRYPPCLCSVLLCSALFCSVLKDTLHRSIVQRGMAAEAAAGGGSSGKPVMVVGIDDSDHSYYALEWTLQHFFAPGQPQQYHLVVFTAKPPASSVIGIAGVGSADLLPTVEGDLKRTVARVIDKAKQLCTQVSDVSYEAMEGDARSVICEAVDRHHAEILVVGCHGYSAWKRAVLGSVSDYCTHHAHCTVMIVKRPKHKH
ncbi:hypothetical protein BAE44_0005181 [Dichanthelium oligosanthes]|uniref:UspA domain-containing protein n=1 Tax=Dichanthelium oligosanthes TaxID=888268 RepID=A0A1E5W978_9POAL|nr:hypothetical protein BAE44_0005181 [Dichanthelium oligosanthes]